MVLDTSLLNTEHHEVRIKVKNEAIQRKKRLLLHLVVVAIEKRAFGWPSTTVAKLTIYKDHSINKFVLFFWKQEKLFFF